MAREPIRFFRIPPNYTELSEEEQREVAEAIGEKTRDALARLIRRASHLRRTLPGNARSTT